MKWKKWKAAATAMAVAVVGTLSISMSVEASKTMIVYRGNPVTNTAYPLIKSDTSSIASITAESGPSQYARISAYLSYYENEERIPATSSVKFDYSGYKTTSYVSGRGVKGYTYYVTASIDSSSRLDSGTFTYSFTP